MGGQKQPKRLISKQTFGRLGLTKTEVKDTNLRDLEILCAAVSSSSKHSLVVDLDPVGGGFTGSRAY